MSISLSKALRGGPEMAFWPSLVALWFVIEMQNLWVTLVTACLIAAGSITYVLLRNTREMYNEIQSRRVTKQRHQRKKRSSDSGVIEVYNQVLNQVIPEKRIKQVILLLSTLITGVAFPILWVMLYRELNNLPFTIVGLGALPVFYVSVGLAVIFWNY